MIYDYYPAQMKTNVGVDMEAVEERKTREESSIWTD